MGLLGLSLEPDPAPRTTEPRMALSWLTLGAGVILLASGAPHTNKHANAPAIVIAGTVLAGLGLMGLLGSRTAAVPPPTPGTPEANAAVAAGPTSSPLVTAGGRRRGMAIAACSVLYVALQASGMLVRIRPGVRMAAFVVVGMLVYRLFSPRDEAQVEGAVAVGAEGTDSAGAGQAAEGQPHTGAAQAAAASGSKKRD
ncbi:hypothetical protein HYH03_018347 [Edaphochlamys debaryana]|uniref:Uncharacterized protein n=1 Tax=Edaphochlamys debaryana TaxID=47281 RepID=A0A835XH99_9CHLO|nr:hypothetical protein HYH03_018347 [Edaphochlamys debaryana]|eukprot:KAG2482753.1 hypothetical protein HYH03_018347 [Edaphochlamys debaryana]